MTWTCERCHEAAKDDALFCCDVACWTELHSFEVRCECGQRIRFGLAGTWHGFVAQNRPVELVRLEGLSPEVH